MPLPDLDTLQPHEIVELIYEQGRALARLELELEEAEAKSAELRKRKNRLARKVMPPLFEKLHAERMSIPGIDAEVVYDTRITAHIPADWDDELKAAGYAEVERLGGEELLHVKFIVRFGRGEMELAAEFLRYIAAWNKLGGREVQIDKSVSTLSLTKFVRELHQRRVPMNLAALGATQQRQCRIEWIPQ